MIEDAMMDEREAQAAQEATRSDADRQVRAQSVRTGSTDAKQQDAKRQDRVKASADRIMRKHRATFAALAK